jgi:5'-3' exoribonuclease 1
MELVLSLSLYNIIISDAPRLSDITNLKSMAFNFTVGAPFRPFDQLMGVLPSLSCQHVPECLRVLMTDEESPISDFYPTKFELDMNGKKNDWEAVVKIPFIDEKRLLDAIESRLPLLTAEERQRNSVGIDMIFSRGTELYHYPSSLPSKFPDIAQCRTKMIHYHLPIMGPIKQTNLLCKNVLLGSKLLPGFCSLDTIPHTSRLANHGVVVFGTESK